MVKLIMRRIDDFHHHFRDSPILQKVLSLLVSYCGRAIVMPNLNPPILTGKDVMQYRNKFYTALEYVSKGFCFKPLMTIDIVDTREKKESPTKAELMVTTPDIVYEAYEAGAIAGKVYPLGVTTNSANGLKDFFSPNMNAVLRAMQDTGMILLLHGEIGGERILTTEREGAFLDTFKRLVEENPDLKIVFEHISTKSAVRLIQNMGPNVAGTITAHHLTDTLNDVIGDGVHPHNMCMPVPKSYDDRDALVEAATSGNPKFFFGSDSAPHPRNQKECSHGKCGQFTVPVALPMLAEVFEQSGALHRLETFTSQFGAKFYELPFNEGSVTLVREDWKVPDSYGDFIPPNAGKCLRWKVVS